MPIPPAGPARGLAPRRSRSQTQAHLFFSLARVHHARASPGSPAAWCVVTVHGRADMSKQWCMVQWDGSQEENGV